LWASMREPIEWSVCGRECATIMGINQRADQSWASILREPIEWNVCGRRGHQSWASIREPIEWSVCGRECATIMGINQRADRMDRGLRQLWASILREPIKWNVCGRRVHQSWASIREPIEWSVCGRGMHQSWASIREPIEWSFESVRSRSGCG
jgi:hypothetical protein